MRAFLSLGQGEPLPRSGIAREINLLSCASCLSSRTDSRALGNFRLNRASRDDAIWLHDVLNRESAARGVRVRLRHDGMLTAEWNRFVP